MHLPHALDVFGRLLLCVVLFVLPGCARDSEAAVRAQVGQWFFLGDALYFKSESQCTAAVYRVTVDRPRPQLRVATDPEVARAALRRNGVAALRIEGYSPHDLTDALLLSGDGGFGKQALHASALAAPCMKGTKAGARFFEALTRPGATLAYDAESEGVMIFDEMRYLLFYVAGDVW